MGTQPFQISTKAGNATYAGATPVTQGFGWPKSGTKKVPRRLKPALRCAVLLELNEAGEYNTLSYWRNH